MSITRSQSCREISQIGSSEELTPGVVAEHVDRAELVQHAPRELLDLIGIGHVDRHAEGARAALGEARLGFRQGPPR